MAEHHCPLDGSTMLRDVRPFEITYGGRSMEVSLPGWYCPSCSESIHDGRDMKVTDRALNRLKAQDEGRLLPEDVRSIRKKLKVTQRDAGRIIGGGPNAFQKYESGDVLVSRSLDSALRLLERDPSGLQVLRAHSDSA